MRQVRELAQDSVLSRDDAAERIDLVLQLRHVLLNAVDGRGGVVERLLNRPLLLWTLAVERPEKGHREKWAKESHR